MESVGAVRIFERSREKYGLQYVNYLGDGDSSSYRAVVKKEPPVYDGIQIEKFECTGHIQKRMGYHLMKKVEACKKKVYMHNGKSVKGIAGRNGLTKKQILKLQGHYGAAIRNNAGDLEKMRQAVWAIFFHRSGDHKMCGEWCPGPEKSFHLPAFVMDELKPVFRDLGNTSLLKKCLHGGSQNTNESFHGVIWSKCPKGTFVGASRLKGGIMEAVIQYNDGEVGKIPVGHMLYESDSYYTLKAAQRLDEQRIGKSIKAAELSQKTHRKVKSIRKADGQDDDHLDYQAGAH